MNIKPKTFFDTFAISLMIQGFTILQGILIARYLGATGRGELAGIILWPNIISNTGLFGINISIARYAAQKKDIRQLASSAFIISIISSFISIIIGYLVIPKIITEKNLYLIGLVNIYLIFILLNHIVLNFMAIDQGTGNFTRMNLTRLLFYPVYLLLLVLLWVTKLLTVKSVIISLLLGNLIVTLFLLIAWRKHIKFLNSFNNIKEIIKGSWQYGSVNIIDNLYFFADQILLFTLLLPIDLGVYVVASSAAAFSGLFSDSNGIIAFTNSAQNTEEKDWTLFTNIIRKSIIIWFIFSLILALLLPFLLPLVYGKDFNKSVTLAIILLLGYGFSGIAKLFDQNFRGAGKPFLGMLGRIASLVVFSTIGYILAKSFGKEGIAFTFIIAQAIYLFFLLFFTKKFYPGLSLQSLIPKVNDLLNFYKGSLDITISYVNKILFFFRNK